LLVDALLATAARFGPAPAVADHTRRLTYRRLTAAAAALRDLIRAETDCPRVGILLPACAAFPPVLFGVLWAGRTAVPLNFLLSPRELAEVVADAGIDTILSVHHFDQLLAQLPARAVALEDLPLRRRTLLRLLRRQPPAPRVSLDDTAALLYTSGTSGDPKGVELTHRNLHSNCQACIRAARIRHNHVVLNVLPPFHAFGLTANVLVPAVLGAGVYALPRFQPAATFRTIRRERVSVVMALPSMYAALLRVRDVPPDALASVYLAISRGEPLPEAVGHGFEERFGVRLHQGYGLTETSPVLSLCAPHAWREGSVGQVLPGIDCRIVDPVGNVLEDAVDGEIQVRGHCVMKGYYNRPADTAAVIDAHGWLRTGDLGHRDADGFLYVTGRLTEALIVAGENVLPQQIEEVLAGHPRVAAAAVIGAPDETRGQVPVAFVTLAEDAGPQSVSEHDLRSYVRRHLAGHKVPRRIHITDQLPTGPTGKILKRKLREEP